MEVLASGSVVLRAPFGNGLQHGRSAAQIWLKRAARRPKSTALALKVKNVREGGVAKPSGTKQSRLSFRTTNLELWQFWSGTPLHRGVSPPFEYCGYPPLA